MGAYSLGHHLWVAGEQYLRDVEFALNEGITVVAETLLVQAEQAFAWSNALQNGEILESLEDMVCVGVDPEDVYVRPEIASLWERVRGGNLPQHRNDGDASIHSPQPSPNVSRETLTPTPTQPAPHDYIEGMETYTATPTPTLTELVASLIGELTKQVMAQVTEAMEAVAESAVENWADGHDFTSDVIESYDFRSAVQDVISDTEFTVTVA